MHESESKSEVAQLCPTLRDPMDCSLPGSSIHGIFQARVLEWGAIAFSKSQRKAMQNNALLKHSNPDIQKRQWQPTPVVLPGESHGQRSLVGCSPWGREESDTTERLPFHFSLLCPVEGSLVGCRLWGRTELDTTEAT